MWKQGVGLFIIRTLRCRAWGPARLSPPHCRSTQWAFISTRLIETPAKAVVGIMILRKHSLLAMGLLFGASLAQAAATSSSYGSSASSTPSIHKVSVGMNGYAYQPNTTYANVGDIIVFEFAPTNHSVIRAEYTGASICGAGGCNPCIPYELIHPGEAGFFSGNFLTQNGDPNTVSALQSRSLRPPVNVNFDVLTTRRRSRRGILQSTIRNPFSSTAMPLTRATRMGWSALLIPILRLLWTNNLKPLLMRRTSLRLAKRSRPRVVNPRAIVLAAQAVTLVALVVPIYLAARSRESLSAA